MADWQTDEPKPLRLWPGVAIVVPQLLARFVVPVFVPEATIFGVFGGLLGGVAILVWWAFFSRAPRFERWGGSFLIIVALFVTSRVVDESIATAGMGMLFFMYAIPALSLAFVIWAVASRHLSERPRRASMVATILLACAVWTLLRSDGMTGGGDAEFAWRWTQTSEERFLAQSGKVVTVLPFSAARMTGAHWPGFRGPGRDGVVAGPRIETDWLASPPVELWRRPIGPGISSFAVRDDRLYTQEQRGDDEVVSSYSLTTGEPEWTHRDPARFWDSHAGAGPRATPTLSGDRVYTFGGTGILNVLNADDGSVVWSRDVSSDTDMEAPYWGFSSSPLVVDEVVIVAAAGQLAAYGTETGDLRWIGPADANGYSSPHLLVVDGVAQVLLLKGAGATSVAPADGTVLWEHPWPGAPIVQPAMTENGDVLISTTGVSGGAGVRRIAIGHGPGGWTTEERWTSTRLKPNFNDFVVHEGHAYGFDGSILACIDIDQGKRMWKGGRYGNGQLLLLPDQDLLLVVSEQGELALVAAEPDRFTELSRFPAIDGKTWNHPALVGDVLLVRNGREMAAFRLPLANSTFRSPASTSPSSPQEVLLGSGADPLGLRSLRRHD